MTTEEFIRNTKPFRVEYRKTTKYAVRRFGKAVRYAWYCVRLTLCLWFCKNPEMWG